MKISHTWLLTSLIVISLVGCAHKTHDGKAHRTGMTVNPGVIIVPPLNQPPGIGNAKLTVNSTTSGGFWWTNQLFQHGIPTTSYGMIQGTPTMAFTPPTGYSGPQPAKIPLYNGRTTTVTVTFDHM